MSEPKTAASAAPRLQIGEVAERVGLSLRTVRYYEEQGLLVPAARSPGGFRLYDDEQVERLALIKEMKPLGFTVEEMRELLSARDALRMPDRSTAGRAEAELSRYAQIVCERCEKLREQLQHGERLADQLRREAQT